MPSLSNHIAWQQVLSLSFPRVSQQLASLRFTEDTEFEVTLLDGSYRSIVAGEGGDNSYELITFGSFGLQDIKQLNVTLGGSGAITHLNFQYIGEDPV